MPGPAYAEWLASLPAGAHRHILAWAETETGLAVAGVARLSVGERSWLHLGWHEIERGGWDAETRALVWWPYVSADALGPGAAEAGERTRGEVVLADPGRLPEVFQERIAASIAVRTFVALKGERGVTVTARRDLDAGDLYWHTTLTRGLTWQMPGVSEAVEEALFEVRTEYDPG